MRLLINRRHWALAAFAFLFAMAAIAADTPKKKKSDTKPLKRDETVGDLGDIISRSEIKLEGVGLVAGLDNSGVEPPPSNYRTKLVEEMQKAGVTNPNNWLKDPRFTLVIVKITVLSGTTPSDRLDVDVELPPGSGTTSLAGGNLLATRLREVMVLGGTTKEGQEAAFAQGPVMIGSLKDPLNSKVGRILGGGRIRKEVPFQIALKETRKSFRNSKIIEDTINHRFPMMDGVKLKGVATAKTDQVIVLKVPEVYHQNQDRFFRVVKLLSVIDTPALQEERKAEWGKFLLDPRTAGLAALRLEGLGVNSVDTLKTGLTSTNSQVRFLAAEALAYLNDPSGADVLAETVIKKPEFRAYALAAMASMDQPVSHLKLRKLMDEPDIEVRYGAFNALRTLAADDELLGRVRVLNPTEEPQDEETDSMSAAISSSTRRKPRVDDPFKLYLVDSEGPPMVHIARTRRCEIVVFGQDTKLLPPIVLGKGSILLNAADGDEKIEISKIVPSQHGDADQKVFSSLSLGDVIRQAANLGASYPEVVSILQDADRQKNLPGPLVVDAVPGTSPVYVKAAIFGEDTTAKKDDALAKSSLDKEEKPSRFNFLDRFRKRLKPKSEDDPK